MLIVKHYDVQAMLVGYIRYPVKFELSYNNPRPYDYPDARAVAVETLRVLHVPPLIYTKVEIALENRATHRLAHVYRMYIKLSLINIIIRLMYAFEC